MVRTFSVNDEPIGRSIDETYRLLESAQFAGMYEQLCIIVLRRMYICMCVYVCVNKCMCVSCESAYMQDVILYILIESRPVCWYA